MSENRLAEHPRYDPSSNGMNGPDPLGAWMKANPGTAKIGRKLAEMSADIAQLRAALAIYADRSAWTMVDPNCSVVDACFRPPGDEVDGWVIAEKALARE